MSVAEKNRTGRWLRALLLIGSGALTGLCVSYPVLGVFEWVSLLPALMVFTSLAEQPKFSFGRLYRGGFLFFYSFSLVIFSWFWEMYPLEFTALSETEALGVVLVAWLGLSLLQTLVGALIPVAFALIARGDFMRRHSLLQIPLWGALWCVREWVQTLGWTGVPWGRLALGQAAFPVMLQTASWFGSYFVTFVLVAFNAAIVYLIRHADKMRVSAAIAGGLLLLQSVGGVVCMLVDPADEKTVRVAAIQGNVGSADKWDMKTADIWDIYYGLTLEAAQEGVDVIVWPESAVPVDLEKRPSYRTALTALAREYHVTLLLGVFSHGEANESYNTILMIGPDGQISDTEYHKRHPVPFGEYVPMREVMMAVFPPLASIGQLSNDLTAGKDAAVFDTEAGRIGALICFDSIYEQLALDSARSGAQILAISTNDSWFFDSAAVSMHNAQAQLRAIETGRYVIRAANTGISSFISPTGKVTDRLGALREGVLYGEVAVRDNMTLYTRVGNLWVLLCGVGAGGLLLLRVVESILKKCKKREEK